MSLRTARERAPEGLWHVARGQSEAATPGHGRKKHPQPRRGGGFHDPSAAPPGLGEKWDPLTRGRRACGALTPGYMPWPLRGQDFSTNG